MEISADGCRGGEGGERSLSPEPGIVRNLCTRVRAVPPTSADLSVFLLSLCTDYGQKVKNTDVKSAPEGVASLAANDGLEHCTEKLRKNMEITQLAYRLL